MRMEDSRSTSSSSTNRCILYDASQDPAATAAEPMNKITAATEEEEATSTTNGNDPNRITHSKKDGMVVKEQISNRLVSTTPAMITTSGCDEKTLTAPPPPSFPSSGCTQKPHPPPSKVASVHEKKQRNHAKLLAETTSTNAVLSKSTAVNITRDTNTNTADNDDALVVDAEPCVSKLPSSSSVVLPLPILLLLPTTGPLPPTPKHKIGTTVLKVRWIVFVI
jgi:hypothetical protein